MPSYDLHQQFQNLQLLLSSIRLARLSRTVTRGYCYTTDKLYIFEFVESRRLSNINVRGTPLATDYAGKSSLFRHEKNDHAYHPQNRTISHQAVITPWLSQMSKERQNRPYTLHPTQSFRLKAHNGVPYPHTTAASNFTPRLFCLSVDVCSFVGETLSPP